MPTTLQYPLERQRDLQRRWGRLLERTLPPHKPLSSTPQAHHLLWRTGAGAKPAPTKRK
jgi:hypothetical protein